jgi:putative NIF3 family GTP cyclohydrolase 1 type 2
VVTGAGASFIEAAAAAGLDTLLTGEGPHHSYFDAMELGVNVLFAGHYATETWGIRAICQRIATEFDLEWEFQDFPTGL